MKCPVCSVSLSELRHACFACPNDHGLLLSAGEFLDVTKASALEIDSEAGAAAGTVSTLACPHCGKNMHKVDYNATGIIIDSCTNCHYRWFDEGELRKIKDYDPTKHTNADDLVFLAKLGQEDQAGQTGTGPDPEAPGYHSVLGGAIRGVSAGDSRKTFAFMNASVLAGIAKAMIRSRFWRIAGPLIIAAMLLAVWIIVKQMQEIDWSLPN